MAVLMLLACGFAAGACAWVAFGGGHTSAQSMYVRLQLARRTVGRGIDAIQSSATLAWLMRRTSFSQAASDLAEARRFGGRLSVQRAGALLLMVATVFPVLCVALCASLAGIAVAAAIEVVVLLAHSVSAARRRRRELAEKMPDVFRTLATALESGHTLVQAIDYVGLHGRGPAAESFVRTSLRLRCGMSMDDALARLTHELDAPGVDLMATALAISQRTGSPLKDLFQRLAVLVERSQELERVLAVRTAQVRLSVRIVVGLPPLMVCLLALISADYRQGLATTAGMACLFAAAAMDGTAVVVIRRILGEVL